MREYIETYMANENTKFAKCSFYHWVAMRDFYDAMIGYDFRGQVYYSYNKMSEILKKIGLNPLDGGSFTTSPTDHQVDEKILHLMSQDKINIIVIPKKL